MRLEQFSKSANLFFLFKLQIQQWVSNQYTSVRDVHSWRNYNQFWKWCQRSGGSGSNLRHGSLGTHIRLFPDIWKYLNSNIQPVRLSAFIFDGVTCRQQIVSFGCSNDTGTTCKNSARKRFLIAITYTLSFIQMILFCKIERVIRLSISKCSQFGNGLFRVVKKLITTAISAIKT